MTLPRRYLRVKLGRGLVVDAVLGTFALGQL